MEKLNNVVIEECKIMEDINHCLSLYVLKELHSEEEIKEALAEMLHLSQNFRHVHVELKALLGDKYNAKYPLYNDTYESLMKYVKEGKTKLRTVRSEAQNSSQSDEKNALEIELDVLLGRVAEERTYYDPGTVQDVHEVDEYILKSEKFMDELFQVKAKMLIKCPDHFDKEFSKVFTESTADIRQDIQKAKTFRVEVAKQKARNVEIEILQRDQPMYVKRAENLDAEISLRFKSLSKKFVSDLSSLGDHQILEIHQDKTLDSEFNDVLEKVTELSSLVSVGGRPVETLLEKVRKTRDRIAAKKDVFYDELNKIIVDRDISVEKMKNASELTVDLPKFSGYDGQIDFFTFKSEFTRLIENTQQKKFWIDHLKRSYLTGQASTLVESETDYEKIWEMLKESYGSPRLMLQNKLSALDKVGGLYTIKDSEKLGTTIVQLCNSMKDLGKLAMEHDLEGQLYEGGGLEKVMSLIGESRHRKFRSENLSVDLSKKQLWQKLQEFLGKEKLLTEKVVLDQKNAELMGYSLKKTVSNKKNEQKNDGAGGRVMTATGVKAKCHLCGTDGHTTITTKKGNVIVPYYMCERFVKMTAAERLSELSSKNLCTVCLFPGAKKGQHRCYFRNFVCPSHDKTDQVHILLCEQHKTDPKDLDILQKFKDRFIANCPVTVPNFAKGLTFYSGIVSFGTATQTYSFKFDGLIPDSSDRSIFQLQTVTVEGHDVAADRPTCFSFNLFYDGGCGDLVVSSSAVHRLAAVGRALQIIAGPLTIRGVGGQTCISHEGVWAICLPLPNGENAIMSGLVLPTITGIFPTYELSNVENDIRQRCLESGAPDFSLLPKLPKKVGGDTDILIGSKYLRYFPKEIHKFESGLTIFESVFTSSDGTRGIIGGPHEDWEKFERSSGVAMSNVVYNATTLIVRQAWTIEREIPLLGEKEQLSQEDLDKAFCCEMLDPELPDDSAAPSDDSAPVCEQRVACVGKRAPQHVRFFDEIESAGCDVTYRCGECRECKKCKSGPRIEAMSLQDEMEDTLIEKCIVCDLELSFTIAKLPFLADPLTHLEASNEHVALRVFNRQVKTLNANEQDKLSVLAFEQNLQDLGCVEYFSDLPEAERLLIERSPVKYFIPWRPVYKEDSVSTPCRMAFDASMSSNGACSLNSLLAKGSNSLNNLQAITIRWATYPHVFHSDVQKMYNRVRLDSSHWCYQLYLFSQNLDVGEIPVWKVIKTLIYGVRPSGNLAECALRRTVELCKNEYPRAYGPVMNDTYMDDCASGTENHDECMRVIDELQIAVGKTGFSFKGFSISGCDPPPHLSHDGKSVTVLGTKWFPKGDFIKLNIGEQNFCKKSRGRKLGKSSKIPDVLTLTDCAGRAAEVYDPRGLVAPIVGGLKLDVSKLHRVCKGWGDPIPNELKECWAANFDVINELGDIEFDRAVVPSDAVDMTMETLNVADAGDNLVCAAVYVRFLRRDGSHSCQLIFARTKVIHDHTTPRGEMVAAVLNASTGFVVKSSLKDRVKRSWYVTDSQVTLYLINSTTAALKTWPRNRVVEVNRLSNRTEWYHTKRQNMVADLGTRKGATVQQVSPGSPWIEGLPWMREASSEFPLSTVEDIKLSASEKSDANKEQVFPESDAHVCLSYVPKEVEARYAFSKYIMNPNRHKFTTVVRIVALVFLFIQRISANLCARTARTFDFLRERETKCIKPTQYIVFPIRAATSEKVVDVAVIEVPYRVLSCAENYYFRKAAAEVQHFVEAHKYEKSSVLKDEILYFTGRILPSQKIDGKFHFGDAMLDLSESTFCVPMTDALSPIAYAIVSETHWYDPDVKHEGVETTLRYAQNLAYIIGGRDLVKMIKKACAKCRILYKKGVKVAMGPVADESLNIAPPFYCSQVDICGHFNAYSPANKRATIKVWILVFVCTATCAVDCRIMESYDAESFILAFIRFSCRFGYPKRLMPDEGSQLIKGCKDMVLSFNDIAQKLSVQYGVEFKTCPVAAHYMHGKVERKIQHVRRSLEKTLQNDRISVLQWETLVQQISNSINNLPIGLGNLSDSLENLDVITPNRLILGRNNNRSPNIPLQLSGDFRKIVDSNNKIFDQWFKEWLTSYVPKLVRQPKWFSSDRNVAVGDVVIFKKSDKEFDKTYQYGIVTKTFESRDGLVRSVEVQYQNFNENSKRVTKRGVREIIVIHPVDELGISAELDELAKTLNI